MLKRLPNFPLHVKITSSFVPTKGGALEKVAIVTDSVAGLTPAILDQFEGTISVVPLSVNFGNVSVPDVPGADKHEFYNYLSNISTAPTTAAPSIGTFAELYEELLHDHDGIVSIHIARRTPSVTVDVARSAASGLDPKRERIQVIDSGFASVPEGLLVIEAAKKALAGEDSSKDIARSVIRNIPRIGFLQTANNLDYLKRSGRIGRASAWIAGTFDIRVILTMNDGEVTGVKKKRTKSPRVISKEMVRLAKLKLGERPIAAFFVNALAEREMYELFDLAKDELNIAEYWLAEQNMTTSAHTGGETYGYSFIPLD